MIAYLDSSVLARAYLADEDGHERAVGLLEDPEVAPVTGTWTRIEVSGTLMRAGSGGRADVLGLLAILDSDLSDDGPLTVLGAPQDEVREHALRLVRAHAIRAMDAWHLAVAAIAAPPLAEPGEPVAFATRVAGQAAVAEQLGFESMG